VSKAGTFKTIDRRQAYRRAVRKASYYGSGKRKSDYTGTIAERPISTAVHAVVHTAVGNTVRPGSIIGESAYRTVIHSAGSFEIRCLDTGGDSLS
jgi:hypothetical protein